MPNEFEGMLSEYWDAAYAEGAEGRTHDSEDGRAQRALSALREHYDALRARLAEVEAQRDALRTALDIIQSGFEYRNGDPKMDGTFDRFPHVLNRPAMKEIAREALAKLEEK
jgi:gamma-glutamyl:cysteine ligase YbdK (ATP-grasp superfamily)